MSNDAPGPLALERMPAWAVAKLKGDQRKLPDMHRWRKLVAASGLGPVEKATLHALSCTLNRDGAGYRSYARLSTDASYGLSAVKSAMKVSLYVGFVDLVRRGSSARNANDYQARYPATEVTKEAWQQARAELGVDRRRNRRAAARQPRADDSTDAELSASLPAGAPDSEAGAESAPGDAPPWKGPLTLDDLDAIDDEEWRRYSEEFERNQGPVVTWDI